MRRFLAVGLAAACAVAAGCNPYPEVSGGESVELIAALRTACSSRRADRLDRVAAAVDERRAEGELSESVGSAFQEIIALARAGKWQEAERETHRFQQAQIR